MSPSIILAHGTDWPVASLIAGLTIQMAVAGHEYHAGPGYSRTTRGLMTVAYLLFLLFAVSQFFPELIPDAKALGIHATAHAPVLYWLLPVLGIALLWWVCIPARQDTGRYFYDAATLLKMVTAMAVFVLLFTVFLAIRLYVITRL